MREPDYDAFPYPPWEAERDPKVRFVLFKDSQCTSAAAWDVIIGCVCEYIRRTHVCSTCLNNELAGDVSCYRCLERGFRNTIQVLHYRPLTPASEVSNA